MLKKVSFISIFACLAAVSTAIADENLLYNSSFELKNGSETVAAGWQGTYTRDTVAIDGKFSVRCQKTGKSYSEASGRPYPIAEKQFFKLSGKYKGSGGIVYVLFRLNDKKTSLLQRSLKSTPNWTDFAISGQVPQNAIDCTVMLRCWNKQPVWFDAVKLQADKMAERLANPSFEECGSHAKEARAWKGLYVRKEGGIDGKFAAECISPKTVYCEAQSSPIQVLPRKKFIVNGMYKGSASQIFVFFTLNNKKTFVRNISLSQSKDWKHFNIEGIIPENAVNCILLLRNSNKKIPVLFDKISFVSELPYETSKNAAGIDIRLEGKIFPALQTAQAELVNYLPRTVKGDFIINNTKLRRIIIRKDDKMQQDEWKMQSVNDTLLLTGGGKRGALYAVYHFLEDVIGIHWWNAWEDHVPPAKKWNLHAISAQGKPHFIFRDIYRNHLVCKDNGRFAARNRLNRNGDMPISAAYGEAYTWGPPYHAHTFARYIHGGYRKSNPEFFSVVDGKREGRQYSGQLCLSNKKLRAHLTERMINNIKSSRSSAMSSGTEIPKMYDLSMNDGNRFCECNDCRKKEKEGNISDLLIDFINEIASGVEKQFPDVIITTLAYGKTSVPPATNIKPRKNVLVRYCNTYGSTVYPSEPRNKKYMQYLRTWAAISPKIFSWEHCKEEYPFPYEMGLPELLKNYDRHKFSGIFVESGIPYLMDCYDMKFWLYAKMLENPYADFEALRHTFLKKYYGNAAVFIDEYRKLLDQAQRRVNHKVLVHYFPECYAYMNVKELLHAHKLFDSAEKAVSDNKTFMRRVISARSSLNLLTVFMFGHYQQEWQKHTGKNTPLPLNQQHLAENMRKYWLKTADFYESPEKIRVILNNLIAFIENLSASSKPIAEPPEFKGKTVRHFSPSKLVLFPKPNIKLVKDPEAREGCAFEIIPAAKDYYTLPFSVGAYDRQNAKWRLLKNWDVLPQGEGYMWLYAGRTVLHQNCYVYATRSSTIQALMKNYLELGEKTVDIWCRAKFQGPAYGKKGDKNKMFIDSISLVEIN